MLISSAVNEPLNTRGAMDVTSPKSPTISDSRISLIGFLQAIDVLAPNAVSVVKVQERLLFLDHYYWVLE
jgi:hypothetical protein